MADKTTPAFPNPALANENFSAPFDMSGMSLRDYFAGQALIGCLQQYAGNQELHLDGRGYTDIDKIAEGLYRIADAMLAEREKS